MISVIVPVYNGERQISRCINSLSEQTKKPDEIIVVDDGSMDKTKEIVRKFRKVILLSQEHKGPASARNMGARKAKGDILLFTDSDCEPEGGWVSEMAKPFREKEVAGVQGRYLTRQKGLVPRFVQLEIEDRYDRMRKFEKIDFIGSYSAAYRRRVFLEAGGFDESFPTASGEDPELSFKLSKSRHRMIFNEKAIVYHNHADSLGSYLKQKFWRAYWRVLLYRKHPNKITKESYTPQTLKFQILSFCLSALLLIFSAAFPPLAYLSAASLILLFLLTLPLSAKNFRKDRVAGLSTPAISVLRTAVFSLGLIYGTVRL